MGTGLARLQLSQFGIKRAGLAYLLWVDGSTLRVDTRQHLLMEESRNAVGCVVHQPVLESSHHVAHAVRIARFLEGILREMTNAVGYQLTALCGVQLSLLVEELFHIHTLQLSDALLLGHLLIECVYLLFYILVGG